nr:MAG TPA: hypothetical protein [Caudoviricetes sp.]
MVVSQTTKDCPLASPRSKIRLVDRYVIYQLVSLYKNYERFLLVFQLQFRLLIHRDDLSRM